MDSEDAIIPDCLGNFGTYFFTEPRLNEPYPFPPPEDIIETPTCGQESFTSITYGEPVTQLTQMGYWTEDPDDCTILQTCTNQQNGNPVYKCQHELTGYRQTTTTNSITWKDVCTSITYETTETPEIIMTDRPQSSAIVAFSQ